MNPAVRRCLEAGGTVVTPTQRLSRRLQQVHGAQQLDAGLTAWSTPDILPFDAWTAETWREARRRGERLPGRLTPNQARVLFEDIIRDDPRGNDLLSVSGAAETAWRAWTLWHAWELDRADDEGFQTDESRAFTRWRRRFDDWCREHGWIDTARLPNLIRELFQKGKGVVPPAVQFHGFDVITPQQRALAAILEERGAVTDFSNPEHGPGDWVRRSCPGRLDEIREAAHWVRRRRLANPDERLAVVSPELPACRSDIVRLFTEILTPESVLTRDGTHPVPFNIATGGEFTQYAMIRDGLTLLEWLDGPLPTGLAGQLIRSPYIAGAQEETGARAAVDLRLRETGRPTARLRTAQSRAEKSGDSSTAAAPLLAAMLKGVRERHTRATGTMPVSQWARHFGDILSIAGWPGPRPLTSHEFQLVGRWNTVLNELASLEIVVSPKTMPGALRLLRQLCAAVDFQPENAEQGVDILGPLEAAVQDFDAVWVMGLHDESWPAWPDPNPFITLDLQKHHGLPRATAEGEYRFTEMLTRRLIGSAPVGVMSWPETDDDKPLRPSPLITHLSPAGPVDAGPTDYRETVHDSRDIVSYPKDTVPALVASKTPGGSDLLKLQAACAFRAFAERRLHAKPVPATGTGFDMAERGTIVHRALHEFWKKTRTLAALKDLSDTALQERVADAVGRALEKVFDYGDSMLRELRVLEHTRVARLVRRFLAVEATREPFSVEAAEESRDVTVGELTLTCRVDRIDRLDDGSLMVVDYKTGRASAGDWFETRPGEEHRLSEPQLPLYAVGVGEEVKSLAYAAVTADTLSFRGIADTPGHTPGLSEPERVRGLPDGLKDWTRLTDYWSESLERLAADYAAGVVNVNPKSSQTCRYCHLGGLCRIDSLTGLDDD